MSDISEYREYIKNIQPAIDLTFKIIYEQYAVPKNISKQDLINSFVSDGVEAYKKDVLKGTKLSMDECIKDLQEHVPEMTRNECISAFSVRGMTDLAEKEFNCSESMELFEKFKNEYRDDIKKVFMS